MDWQKTFWYFAAFFGVVSLCAIVFIGSGINFTYMSKADIKTIANLKCQGQHTFNTWLQTLEARRGKKEPATFNDLAYSSSNNSRSNNAAVLAQQIVITPMDWVIAALGKRNRLGDDVSKEHRQIACDRVRAFTDAVNQITYAYALQTSHSLHSNSKHATCEKMRLVVSQLTPPQQ